LCLLCEKLEEELKAAETSRKRL